MAGVVGFEPTTFGLTDRRSTYWSYTPEIKENLGVTEGS